MINISRIVKTKTKNSKPHTNWTPEQIGTIIKELKEKPIPQLMI
jgi:hypothetical protein